MRRKRDVTKDDMEIVSAVRTALIGRVGQDRFATWFGRGVRMEPRGTTLRIAAAERFRLDFLKRKFRADLIATIQATAGRLLELEFVLEEALGSTDAAAADATTAQQPPEAKPPAPPIDQLGMRGDETPTVRQPGSTGSVHSDRPAQPLARRQFASLVDFLASEPNRVAFSAAQTAATRPGCYTPLTFVGPPGTGKTHLLEGIWRHARTARSVQRVLYLSAEQFTNQFIDALRESGTPNFRRKIRDAEMLLIDDVQFFAGKQSTLIEVAHTIDALVRGGKQLVFAADRPPAELRGLGADIITRLSGGLVCTLEPADCATRLAILRQMAARMDFPVPADVHEWLAAQLAGDARHLAGALNRLRAASEAHNAAITLEFAQAALSDLVAACRRPVRLPEIVEAVCDVFGVDEEDLKSSSKAASVAVPRMLVMFLARKWTRAALSEISKKLGRKSHSTVLSAQQKIESLLAAGKTVSLARRQCGVEDAIKRVEAQLRLA